MYVDTNGSLKIYNGSAWDSVGSGAGTTNYISTADSKVDTIANFRVYDDGVVSSPVDGYIADITGVSVTKTLDDNSLLRGLNSLKFSKDAANRKGEGIAYDFTIDAADNAKKLLISFDYKTSTAYADDDIAVFIFDDDTDTIIRVNGESIKATTGTKQFIGQFQTHATSDSYRLIFHITSVNAAAYDLFLDNISVAPQTVTQGAMATDFTSYTPTLNSETNVSAKYAQYKRVGDSIEVKFAVKYSGQGHSSGFTLALPSGLTFDTTKMPQVAEADGVGFLGSCAWYNAGTGTSDLQVAYSTTTAVHIFGDLVAIGGGHGDGSGEEATNSLQSNYLYTNDYLSGTFTAPITGWSANTQMSEDFSGRDVVFSAGNSSATSIATTTAVLLTYDTEEIDTTNSMSAGTYTVPEKGYYDISYQTTFTPTADWDAGELGYSYIVHNSTTKKLSSIIESQASTADVVYMGVQTTCILNCEKGDTLKFYIRQETGATLTLQADVNQNYISIAKRSSPQTVLENETVACRIRASASVAMNLSSAAQLTFNTTDFDTHGGFSDGNDEYTIPVTGYYSVNAHLDLTGGTDAEQCLLTLRKDDVIIMQKRTIFQAQYAQAEISDIYYFTKGDTVQLYGQVTSDTTVVVQEAAAVTSFSIAKIK